jgi:mannose-6-phosphate isomerase-like protein (cupin superfamily)
VDKVNVAAKLASFADHWNPRVVAELNGQQVKVVKLAGEFVWHHHDHEDELFLVVRGCLRMELRDKVVELLPGELIVIPRGVEHRPVAVDECEVMLFEPATTLNTGEVADDPRTRRVLEHI